MHGVVSDEYTDGSRLVKGRYRVGTMPNGELVLHGGQFDSFACGEPSKASLVDGQYCP